MRLAIFVGLTYLAWCTNPTTFDYIKHSNSDIILVNFVLIFAAWADLKDLFKKQKP